MTSSTVFRVVHGKELSSYPRCPICGAKLKTNRCRACELRRIQPETNASPPDLRAVQQAWDNVPVVIQLRLRPQEYIRYLDVRRRKEEREQYKLCEFR